MPGMGSFNLWSGVPTPDDNNLTAWVQGIGLERQRHTLDILTSSPRACVITDPELMKFWQTPPDALNESPLARYILERMPEVSHNGNYHIQISPNRDIAWVP